MKFFVAHLTLSKHGIGEEVTSLDHKTLTPDIQNDLLKRKSQQTKVDSALVWRRSA